jgi:hypothetical protein
MALAVCAYPVLKPWDYKLIQDFRKINDALFYSIAEPHFPFVFPVDDDKINKEQFITEIIDKSNAVSQISFEIRCAMVNKDALLDYYHLLLVPEKGYSKIVKLHDKLYSDLLFQKLRLDIDFIPHMGIANSKDKYLVKNWADIWNQKDFSMNGRINSLTIVDYSNNTLTDLHKIKLK